MLPAHSSSGYCDIQGRRRVIEDFHAIHLSSTLLFYAIFDGHTGNLASKYAASFLYDKLESRLATLLLDEPRQENWKDQVEQHVRVAFYELHDEFLVATKFRTRTMDQSGTTATAAIVAPNAVMIASLGDSRAVLSSRNAQGEVAAIQLTTDHVASNTVEQDLVKARGGTIVYHNGVDRVNGSLAITRSIGDASLSPFLSREADVLTFTRSEIKHQCGDDGLIPCFLILASDGLWDMLSNQEAVDMALEYMQSDEDGSLQQAAEALTLEAYVRGSRDNIGVAVIAID
jgi:protein phosphatase 1L